MTYGVPSLAPAMTSSLPQSVRERMARILPVTLPIARAEADLSREEVAERLGLKEGAYGRIERGLLVPSLRTLRRLCEVLGVSLEDLVDFEGERLPSRPAATPVSRARRLSASPVAGGRAGYTAPSLSPCPARPPPPCSSCSSRS